jgi:hypothetical protein
MPIESLPIVGEGEALGPVKSDRRQITSTEYQVAASEWNAAAAAIEELAATAHCRGTAGGGTVVSRPSPLGTHSFIDTAFDGDTSGVSMAIAHTISGVATLDQPASGYVYTPEAYPHYTYLYNTSGWNEETAGNDGRTSAVAYRTKVHQAGQGDAVAYNATCYVTGTRSGSTSFLANPAASIVNGDMQAGADGVYLNAGEYNLQDEGFDVAGIGWVINLERTVGTAAKDAFWGGVRVQSTGSADVDFAFSATGEARIGMDLSFLTLPTSGDWQAAAQTMKAGQRVYYNATATDSTGLSRYPSTAGTTYTTYTTGTTSWDVVVGGTTALQVSASDVVVPLSLRAAQVASAVNLLEVRGATTGNAPGIIPYGETNVGLSMSTKGTGSHFFYSDSFGNPQFQIARVASTVNYPYVSGGATGGAAVIGSAGETNVGLLLHAKGGGAIIFRSNTSGGPTHLALSHTASAVNYTNITGGTAGSPPVISAAGSDTDVDIRMTPKGAGVMRFGTHSAIAAETVTGYITIKDDGGTLRKLAIVS